MSAPRGANAARAAILNAMQTGMSEVAAIALATGIDQKRVSVELINMQEQYIVRNAKNGHWHVCGPCALERHWRGVRPIARQEVRA